MKPLYWLPSKEHKLGKPDLEQNRQPQSWIKHPQAVQIRIRAREVSLSLHNTICLKLRITYVYVNIKLSNVFSASEPVYVKEHED